MSNRTIRHACEMLRKPETALADVLKYLCPRGGNPETASCVVQEAWHIAKRIAAKPRRSTDKVTRHKTHVERKKRSYRAQRRNIQLGRKPKGNTTPFERRVIWAIAVEAANKQHGAHARAA